ncbi:MAG TPA: hypothetical protein VG821_02300 [Rhizomicrobium sp.]|nr:hypothetical protein [Rhizomicrobium sp.]
MKKLLGIFTVLALSALPAAADPANLLGVFGNWTAYSSGSGSGLTCFATSKPRATRPVGAKRGDIYLMVSDWPGRKVKAEPQIVYGYPAREGGAAALGIGPDKFTFFMRNTGKEGSGWLQALNDNPRLIAAMQGGVSAVASGISQRGTKTVDTYSLSGFNDALTKIHAVCGM